MHKINPLMFLIIMLSSTFGYSQKSDSGFIEKTIKYRNKYKRELIRDLHSPITKYDLRFIKFYQPDSLFRVKCKIDKLENQEFFNFLTSSGKKRKYRKFAKLNCDIKDTTIEFFTYESKRLLESKKYKDYIFLPFTDNTNGETTYGGGRYLDLQRGYFSRDSIIIDFNLCYNPYCAYSSGYSCAIPPRENAISVNVEAGEKNYEGEKKHRAKSKVNRQKKKKILEKHTNKLKEQAKKSIRNKKISNSIQNHTYKSKAKRYFELGQDKTNIEKK